MGERSVPFMGELSILDIKIKKEYVKYLELWNVEVSIPDLEVLGMTRQSILDFQTRFFYELGHLLLTNKVFINNSDNRYTYIFRIIDSYAFHNLNKIKPLGDFILNNFHFMTFTKKRKIITFTEFAGIKKLRIE
jgi:hypothetical protein